MMDDDQKIDFDNFKWLQWLKDNEKTLYIRYYGPLEDCFDYRWWKHCDNIWIRTDEGEEEEEEEEEDKMGCLSMLWPYAVCGVINVNKNK